MPSTTVEIHGKQTATGPIKEVSDSLNKLHAVTGIVADGMTSFRHAIDILKEVGRAALETVEAFGDMQRRMIELKTALGDNEIRFTRMTNLIEEMARKTIEGDSAVESIVAELAGLGRSDADIERVTSATVALSNVTGKSLTESFTLVNNAWAGSTEKLEKLVPELGDLTKEQLAAGDAVDVINKKFQDISDEMATGITQSITNLKTTWGDFKEAIGSNLEPIFSPMIDWIQGVVEKWTDALTEYKKYRDAMKKDADQRTAEDNLAIARKQKQNALDDIGFKLRALGFTSADPKGRGTSYDAAYQNLAKNAGLADIDAKILELEAQVITATNAAEAALGISGSGGGGGRPDTISYSAFSATDMARDYQRSQLYGMLSPAEIQAVYGWNLGGNEFSESALDIGALITPDLEEFFASDFWGTMPSDIRGGPTGPVDYVAEYEAGASADLSAQGGFGTIFPGLATLEPIFSSLGSTFGSTIGSLASLNSILNPLDTIFMSMFQVLEPTINTLLEPLVGILTIIGETAGQILMPVLNMLTPIIELIAEGFVWLYNNALMPVGNFFIGMITDLHNLLDKWFNGKKDQWSLADSDLEAIVYDAVVSAGASTSGTTVSGSSASYTQVGDTVINNYIYTAAMVGDGGFDDFCLLVAQSLRRLGVLGAA